MDNPSCGPPSLVALPEYFGESLSLSAVRAQEQKLPCVVKSSEASLLFVILGYINKIELNWVALSFLWYTTGRSSLVKRK